MPGARKPVQAKPLADADPSLLSALEGDVLGTGVVASGLGVGKLTVALYGRNGVGKTTFACQGKGPTALISIDPSPTGGAGSISGRADIVVYQVSSSFLKSRDGKVETLRGSEKVLAIAAALKQRFARGEQPFRKVVIDGITSWNDVILGEILGVDWDNVPGILGLGKVSADQYTERSERMIRYLKPFLSLPCDLWLIAQERDHNPPKDSTTTRSGKNYSRPAQSRLMQEAHPMSQEGSFFSLAVGDAQALFVQNACDFIMQLYEEEEVREEKAPDVTMNGQVIAGVTQRVATGRYIRRLRCAYHPNYAARFRAPDYRAVPEYIEAPTPEERYQAFMDVIAGKRTKWGHYE